LNAKSGEFVAPEAGLYLFMVTCCTFDMKKCLISIRKNGKDVANCFDQDGDTNKVIAETTQLLRNHTTFCAITQSTDGAVKITSHFHIINVLYAIF
jgi:hypothetical protein